MVMHVWIIFIKMYKVNKYVYSEGAMFSLLLGW